MLEESNHIAGRIDGQLFSLSVGAVMIFISKRPPIVQAIVVSQLQFRNNRDYTGTNV
jgi:hypothetical protein